MRKLAAGLLAILVAQTAIMASFEVSASSPTETPITEHDVCP